MNAHRTVRIILPAGRDHKNSQWRLIRNDMYRRITERYGGVTTWRGNGWWLDERGRCLPEPVAVVECAMATWNQRDRQFWVTMCHDVRREFKQEAVMMTVYGEANSFLVDSDFPADVKDYLGQDSKNLRAKKLEGRSHVGDVQNTV